MANSVQGSDDGVELSSIQKTFNIIEELEEMGNATAGELADEMGIPKSTIYVHLRTLEECGYVIQSDGCYHLSFQFLTRAAKRRDELQVFHQSRTPLLRLATQTGECITLSIREENMGIPIARRLGENAVYDFAPVGGHAELHTTAFGKAILAALPSNKVTDLLARTEMPAITEHTITSREELFEELSEVNRYGYAIDREERNVGIWCIGMAIKNEEDRPIGAISVSGPANRLSKPEYQTDIVEALSEQINVIELNITYEK